MGGGGGRVTNISLRGDRVLRSLTRTRIGKERESIISCLTCTFMSRIQVSVESIFDSVTCKKLCASNIVAVAILFS